MSFRLPLRSAHREVDDMGGLERAIQPDAAVERDARGQSDCGAVPIIAGAVMVPPESIIALRHALWYSAGVFATQQ